MAEFDKPRAVIRRDLADAALDGASAAALEAAKTAITCTGYRVAGAGHKKISFDVVELANGKAADPFSDYFDRRRRKRNIRRDLADVYARA